MTREELRRQVVRAIGSGAAADRAIPIVLKAAAEVADAFDTKSAKHVTLYMKAQEAAGQEIKERILALSPEQTSGVVTPGSAGGGEG